MKQIIRIIPLMAVLICFSLRSYGSSNNNIGDEMFIFCNDGKVKGFLKSMILKMCISDIDDSGKSTGIFDIQEIVTEDSTYRIPLNLIDSISFRKPSTIYYDDVVLLHKTLADHILRCDSNILTIDKYTSQNLLPNIGDKICSFDMPSNLPEGFKGIVREITTAENNEKLIICDDVPLTDVVKRLFAVISSESDISEEDNNDKRRRASSQNKRYHNLGPFSLTTPLDIKEAIPNTLSIDNSIEILIWPIIKTITTVIVDENLGMAVHVDANCSYDLTETINMSGGFSWDKDLPYPGLPAYIDLGYGFRLYLDGGLTLGINGEVVQQHKFKQAFTHNFSLEYYSVNPTNSHTSSRFSLNKTNYEFKVMSGNIIAKFGTFMEVGLAWASKDIVSAGARAEVGVMLNATSSIPISEIATKGNDPDNYQKLRDNSYVSLGGYWGVYGVGSLLMLNGSIGDEHNTGTPLYENYYIPKFMTVSAERTTDQSAFIQLKLSEPSLIPFPVGFLVKDVENNVVEEYYHPINFVKECGFNEFSHTINNLLPDKAYTITPIIKYLGFDIQASPETSIAMNSEDLVTTLGHHSSSDNNQETVYGQINRKLVDSGYIGFEWYSNSDNQHYTISAGNISSQQSDVFNAKIYRANNTTYNYRAFYRPQNTNDEATYGEWMTYTTSKSDLKVITCHAEEIVATAALLIGKVEGATKNDYFHYYFEFSNEPELFDSSFTNKSYYSSGDKISCRISGLKPSSDYYYRLVVEYGEDIIYGDIVHFATIDNGIQYTQEVDLGLSVNWASCNLNALNPENDGGVFQWGQIIEGEKGNRYDTGEDLTWSWVEWDEEINDAARNILGQGWSIPTHEQVQELIDNCTFEILDENMDTLPSWQDYGGRYVKVIGPNGNSLLFPCGGYWVNSGLYLTGQWTDALGNVHYEYEKGEIFIMPSNKNYVNGDVVMCPSFKSRSRLSLQHIRAVKKK